MQKKQNISFNIVRNKPSEAHGGFGIGSISLDNVSPVIIDVEEGTAEIDIAAMHARSKVERGIKFLPDKSEVPNAKPYWLVWVTIGNNEQGPYYAGVTACEMTVDRSIRRGYKNLADHVNNMDRSLKETIIVDQVDDKSKQILADFLKNHNNELWDNSTEELKAGLMVK